MIKNRNKMSKKVRIISSVAAAVLMVSTLGVSGVMASDLLDKDTTSGAENIDNADVSYEVVADNKIVDLTEEWYIEGEYDSDSYTQGDNEGEVVVKLDSVDETVIAKQEDANVIEMVWPCPSSSKITATFNTRVHPITGETHEHSGIDIGVKTGEDVVAAISGEVTGAGWNNDKGYCVVITNDEVEILYAHLSEINVEKGDMVTAGQLVAKAGNTGMSTGPHLHFEVIVNGESLDPEKFYNN